MPTEYEVVDVAVGEEFTVTLDAVPGAGYVWEETHDAAKVELVSEDAELAGTSPGASRVSRLVFRAVAPGDDAVQLRYLRPWETEPLKAVTYRVRE